MEPVEIDIRLKQNVATEGKKVTQSIEAIAAATEKAKAMIDRHQAGIVELKKDLVELGIAYKKATTKEGKSEILTEIELTKKNIIDETQAIKVLKAEIASMKKMPKTAEMPDANQIAKTAMGYNGLNMSMQQIVRELPAASMGLNMFFLAISNNLPVAADAIKRARLENDALKASGASTVPVWKQLMSSIVSWQSLMIVGITVASMYGKEIFQAFSKGSEAAERAKEDTKKFNDAFSQSVADPLVKVNQLAERWNKLGDNLEEKKKFVDANKDAFRDLGVEVNNVKDAENLLVDNVDAFRQAMIAKAMSVAAMQIATEKYQEYFKKMREAEKMTVAGPTFLDKVGSAIMQGAQADAIPGTAIDRKELSPKAVLEQKVNNAKTVADNIKKEGDALISESSKQNDLYEDFLEKAGIKRYENDIKNRDRAHREAYNSERDFENLIFSLKEKSESMLIGLQEDSLSKRLQLINQEKDKEVKAIQDKEIAIIDAYNKSKKQETDDYNKANPKAKKTFTALSTKPEDIPASLSVINPAQAQALVDATTAIEDSYRQKTTEETEKWYNELQALGVKYGDQVTKIKEEYSDRIDKLTKAQAATEDLNRKKELQTSIDSLVFERDAKISAVTAGIIKETELYKLASEDRLRLTKELNKKLIDEAKAKIKADESLTPDDKAKLIAGIDEAGANRANNAIDGLITQFARLKKAKEDAANAKSVGDTEGEAKAAKVVGEATTAIEKYGNEVLNYFDQASSGILGIMDQLGMFTEEEKESANQIVGMVSGAGDLAVGIATGNISQIISGGIALASNAIEFFDKKGKDIAKKQKALEKDVDSLTVAYSRLQIQVDKALGTDVYDAQKAQIANLQAQIAANNAWIEQEQRKKKKKQDAEAIASRKAEIEALKNEIDDVKTSIAQDLAQTTAKELAQQVGDALVQAATNGTDAFVAMGDVVNDVLKNAVTNALEKQFLEKQMGKATDYLSSAMEDGKLTDAERKQFSEMVTAAGNNYNEALAAYKDILGSSDTAREGAKKGIATASQDSIDELKGGVYALRMGVADIRNNAREQTLVIRTITNQLDTLIDNTEPIAEMAEDIKNLSADINDIKTRGINVKV